MSENNGNDQHTETVKGVTINSHQDLRAYVQKLTEDHQAQSPTNTKRIQNAVNGLRDMIQNIGATDMIRTDFLRFLLDGPRDIDGECGYPLVLTPDHYRAMYDRDGISRRVVHCEPEESWQMDPEVYEDEDPENDTEFEKAWKDNCKKWNFYQFLQRIDILSGIGQYGVLLLGLNDGKELWEPVEGFNDDGTIDEENDYSLLYLRVFDETVIWTKVRETDINNPRYGLPKLYTIQFRDFPNWGIQAGEIIARDVHWSRVIHVADNRKMSEVYGQPRMQEVYNYLYNLRKIYSADGEAFWKNGFAALAFEMSPEVADQGIPIDQEGMKKQMERFQNGTQRYIALEGMTVKTLPPAVVDPTPHTKVHLTAIATSKAIPYRILFGSEEAKLAGEKDSEAWNKRVARRQSLYVTPMLLRPFVDRMIAYGVLPKPKVEYFVDWPDLNAPSDQDKATVALTKTQAMAAYIQSGLSQLMSPRDFYVTILSMSVEEADSLLDNAADFNGSEGDQNDDSQFDEDQPNFPKDQEETESNEGGLGGANPDNGSNLEQKNLSRRTTVGGGQAVDAQLVQQPSLNVEAGKPNHPFDVTVQKLVNNVNAGVFPYLGKPDTNNLLLTAAVYKRELELLPKSVQCFVDNALFTSSNQEFESRGLLMMPDAPTINEWSKEAEEARWAGHIKAEPGAGGGTATMEAPTKKTRSTWNGHSMVDLIRHSAVRGLSKDETAHLLKHGMGLEPSKHTIYVQHRAALAGGKRPVLSMKHKGEFDTLAEAHIGRKPAEETPHTPAAPTPTPAPAKKSEWKPTAGPEWAEMATETASAKTTAAFAEKTPEAHRSASEAHKTAAGHYAPSTGVPGKHEAHTIFSTTHATEADRLTKEAAPPIVPASTLMSAETKTPRKAPAASETEVELEGGKKFKIAKVSGLADTHSVVHVDLDKVLSRMSHEDYVAPGGGDEGSYGASRYSKLASHAEGGGEVGMPSASYVTGHNLKVGVGKTTIALLRDKGAVTAPFMVPHSDVAKFTKAFGYDASSWKPKETETPAPEVTSSPSAGTKPEHYTKVELPYRPPKVTHDKIERGLDVKPEEMKEAADKLKALASKAHMISRVPESKYHLILEGGRFKTQFETGKSMGAMSHDLRSAAEYKGLGTPKDIDAKLRPYYGYLHSDPKGGTDAAHYGEVKFRFKPELRPRTTFTIGDSLGGMGSASQAGTPINDPSIHSFGGKHDFAKLEKAKTINDLNYSYTEMQIHGGVSLKDVEAVVVPRYIAEEDKFKRLKKKHLDPLGITVEVE